MKKTLIAFFVLSVLVAACPVFAVDVSKEPTGFRGIKWDVPIKDYPNTFERFEAFSTPRRAAYTKIKEKKSFAGHKIDLVVYFFDSVGFVEAMVFALPERGSGLSIYNDFVEACNLQWGRGRKTQNTDFSDAGSYVWEFPSSRAVVNYAPSDDGDDDSDLVNFTVYSIAGQVRRDERKSLEGETDF